MHATRTSSSERLSEKNAFTALELRTSVTASGQPAATKPEFTPRITSAAFVAKH